MNAFLKNSLEVLVVHACSPSAWEAESGQSGLYNTFLKIMHSEITFMPFVFKEYSQESFSSPLLFLPPFPPSLPASLPPSLPSFMN